MYVCVCNYSSQTTEPICIKKLYQQIECLTLNAIGYLDLKYLPLPYLKPQKPISGAPVMLNQWEIEDSCKAHSKINRKIFAVYGSNDVVQTKDGLLGFGRWVTSFGGKCAPKTPQKGVNRHFQAKLAQYWNSYLGRGSSDFDEIWHTDAVIPSWPFRLLKIWNFENPRWRRTPSWNIEKSRYLGHGWSDIDKIWHNDAVPPSWPFWPLKNWNFENPSWNLVCELICMGALTEMKIFSARCAFTTPRRNPGFLGPPHTSKSI